ncbi:MAG TPA: VWA domain-containing protein, partial [Anaerolineae bacterium]|nr:VWA domain-containing protein [Anaerolineae bacterium]
MNERWVGRSKTESALKRAVCTSVGFQPHGYKPLSIIILLFMLLLAGSRQVLAQDATESAIPNLEVIILLDESGSMWRETDPDDRRGDAVELFVNALGVDASSAEFRTAIITFGTDATLFG